MAANQVARIITVFNEKGGAGKTTLSCNLAHSLSKRGFKVKLLDLDGQRAAKQWEATPRRPGAEGFGAEVWSGDLNSAASITEHVQKFSNEADILVADCAPSIAQPSTWAMLLVSDLALIPTKISKIDLDALVQAKALARRALEQGGSSYPVAVVAMGVRMHLNDDKFYIKQLQKDQEFPILNEMLGFRSAYPRSRVVGSSVHGVAGAADAIAELDALTNRVLSMVKLPKRQKEAA